MGLVKNGKSGIFYIRFKHQNQLVKRSLRTKNSFLAEELYHIFMRDYLQNLIFTKTIHHQNNSSQPVESLANEIVLDKKSVEPTIKKLYPEYIQVCELKGFSEYTINIKKQFHKHLELFNIKKPSDFSQENINKLFEYWTKEYKHNSIAKFSAETKAFIHWLIKKRLYTLDNYNSLDFPTFKTKAKELVIKNDDLEKINQYAEKKDYDFYLYLQTLFYTISRANEPVKLQLKHINFEQGEITIFTSKTARIGKPQKTIPLFPEIKSLLKDFVDKNRLQSDDFFFRGASCQHEFYGKKFKDLKEKLGLNPEYTLTTFRHTADTQLYKKTKDALLVAKIAGHKPEIAVQHYINLDMDYYKDSLKGVKMQG